MTVVEEFASYAEQPFAWRGFELSELRSARRKLIDAAGLGSNGDTGSGGYTDHVCVEGVGKGLTVTPTKGDTGKTVFFPNAGERRPEGIRQHHGMLGYYLSVTEIDATTVWRITFGVSYTSGYINSATKLWAYSLRCVRS